MPTRIPKLFDWLAEFLKEKVHRQTNETKFHFGASVGFYLDKTAYTHRTLYLLLELLLDLLTLFPIRLRYQRDVFCWYIVRSFGFQVHTRKIWVYSGMSVHIINLHTVNSVSIAEFNSCCASIEVTHVTLRSISVCHVMSDFWPLSVQSIQLVH